MYWRGMGSVGCHTMESHFLCELLVEGTDPHPVRQSSWVEILDLAGQRGGVRVSTKISGARQDGCEHAFSGFGFSEAYTRNVE